MGGHCLRSTQGSVAVCGLDRAEGGTGSEEVDSVCRLVILRNTALLLSSP